jgi:hypothetical protein
MVWRQHWDTGKGSTVKRWKKDRPAPAVGNPWIAGSASVMLDSPASAMQISPKPIGVMGRGGWDASQGRNEVLELRPKPCSFAAAAPGKAGTRWCRGSATQSTGLGRAGDTTAIGDARSLPPDHFPPVGPHSWLLGQPAYESDTIDCLWVRGEPNLRNQGTIVPGFPANSIRPPLCGSENQ